MSQTKVLIIDDDEDIIETTGELLKFKGFQVYSADTTQKGISMIDEISPDILLLDIMFPEKKTKGFDAAKEIKEKHPKLPIIVFTSIIVNTHLPLQSKTCKLMSSLTSRLI